MRPSTRSVQLCLLWLALGVAAAFAEPVATAFWLLGALLFAALLAEWLVLRRTPMPEVHRTLPATLSLGATYDVTLGLRAAFDARVTVDDEVPAGGHVTGLPCALELSAGRDTTLTYRYRPERRGELEFGRVRLFRRGPMGLWEQRGVLGQPTHVRVYPNFRHLVRYVSPGEQLFQHGLQLQRRRGDGMEFHQLRPYQQGDASHHIDWKSVSRRQQLVTREYRAEQNQSIVLAVDCGRRMRVHDGPLTLLDQALNASLLLAHVALGQGDAVGISTFGSETRRFLPPVRGAAGLKRVLDAVYDVESTTQPGDLEEVAGRLMVEQRRRALVVVLTNLGDDDVSSLLPAFRLLRRKHLVLLASLRDPMLMQSLEAVPREPEQALASLSTLAYLGEARAAQKRLAASGIDVLESEPGELPFRLVEHYMRIKRAGRL